MRKLVRLLGWDGLRRLAATFGGRRVYMPVAGPPPALMTTILDAPSAEEIRKLWAGGRVEIPTHDAVMAAKRRAEKRERAATMLAEGHSVRSVAAVMGISPRSVRRLK